MPTLPPSLTVNTSLAPSKRFKISPVPLWVIATPTVLLFAPTSNLSTSVSAVSRVVVVPSTSRSPITLRLCVVTMPDSLHQSYSVPRM